MSKYPRLGEKGRVPHKGESGRIGLIRSTCYVCGRVATHYVDIEFSWFRGDDGTYPLCPKHKAFPENNLRAFLDYLNKKENHKKGEKDESIRI